MIKLSVIIPARNEFPMIAFTIHSILACWEADGYDPKEIEIIIVDNCSNDKVKPHTGTKGTVNYLYGRGAYFNRVIRVIYDPIAGNHSARNKGALIARGKYLFFSDAHVAYHPGFFKHILPAVDESGGLVHGVLQVIGAYPPTEKSGGYGYSVKLGEEIKGTWNNYKLSDDWFYVPSQGHWGFAVDRKQFLKFHGYPGMYDTNAHLYAYGGGEFFLNMKWWMFGFPSAVEPKAIGYHLASGRNYTYHHNNYKENVLGMSYALGMDDWRERAYLNWCRHTNKEEMDIMMERTEKHFGKEREFINKHKKYTFNQVILDRPWDRLNKERCGHAFSGLTIFHDTWLDLIKGTEVEVAYNNSKYQKDLDKFIRENLSEFIYKK